MSQTPFEKTYGLNVPKVKEAKPTAPTTKPKAQDDGFKKLLKKNEADRKKGESTVKKDTRSKVQQTIAKTVGITPQAGWTLNRQEAGIGSSLESEMHSWDIQNFGVATFGDVRNVPKDKRALWQARQAHKARIGGNAQGMMQSRAQGIDQINRIQTPIEADNNDPMSRALGMGGLAAVSPLAALTSSFQNAGDVLAGRDPRGTRDIASFLAKTTPNIEGMNDAELYGRAAASPLTRFFQEPVSFTRAGTGDTRTSDELSGLGAGAEFIGNIIPQAIAGSLTGGATIPGKIAAGVSLDLVPIAQMVQDMGGIDKLPAMGRQLVETVFDPNAPEGARTNAALTITMLGLGATAGGVAGAKKLAGGGKNVPAPRIPDVQLPKSASVQPSPIADLLTRKAPKIDENLPTPTFRTPRPRAQFSDADVLPTPTRTRARKGVEAKVKPDELPGDVAPIYNQPYDEYAKTVPVIVKSKELAARKDAEFGRSKIGKKPRKAELERIEKEASLIRKDVVQASMAHKTAIKDAYLSGKLTTQKYNEIHLQRYGDVQKLVVETPSKRVISQDLEDAIKKSKFPVMYSSDKRGNSGAFHFYGDGGKLIYSTDLSASASNLRLIAKTLIEDGIQISNLPDGFLDAPTRKQTATAKLKTTAEKFKDTDVIIGVKQGKNRGSVARINPEKVKLLRQLAKDAAEYGIATLDEFVDYVGGMVDSASDQTKKIFKVAAKQVWEAEKGKAAPVAEATSPKGATGLANRVNDAETATGSLSASPKGKGVKKGTGQAEGKRQVQAGEVNPSVVANDIAQKQRAFANEVEVGVLMEGKRQLVNARDSARAAWDKAIDSKGDTTFAKQEFDKAQAELDDFVGKVQTAKTKTSDAFRALQEGTRLEDGTFDDILDHYARKNNKKRSDLDLNSKDLVELKKVVEARDSTIKKLEEMIAKKESAKVESGFATARGQARSRGPRTRDAIRTDMDAAKARLKESVKKSLIADSSVAGSGFGALGGNFQALAKNAPEVVKAIKDIVVLTIEDLNVQRLDKTFYDAVRKESEMDLSDSDIRQVMAGFYNPNPAPITELQKRISSLKTQARILEEIKGVKDGTPIEKSVSRTKPDAEIQKLKKQLSDLTKPEREAKAKQATVARRIAKLDKEIALIKNGRTITRKTPGAVDPRVAKLQAERARLVKIRDLKAEIKAREAGTFKRKPNLSAPVTDVQINTLQKRISELRAVETEAKRRAMLTAKIKKLQGMKQSGAKRTSQPRKPFTNLDLRAIKDSLVKDLALRDTITDLESQLASGNFAVKPPREVRELTVEQAKLQKRVDDLRKQIKMMVKLNEPKTPADKLADFIGASVLSNPVARAFDLAANTVKLGSYLATNGLRVPMHVAMDRLFLKGVSGGGERLITIRKLRRAMEGYGASVREESSQNMKGMDPDSASKYGRGSFVARATGMTDIPFKEFYNRLALDDMASAIAEKELGRRAPKADLDYRIRELIQNPTDEMVAVAHDWALRQTFNIDNVFGKLQRNIVTTFEELGRVRGGDAGKAWGKVVGIIAETPFRFSKVIGNVALDRLNSNPVAAAIESSIRGVSMVKYGYSPQQARLIADIAAKGLTGMALTYAGQYAYENGAYDPELIKTEGGTMFFDFGKIAQIGGPLAPFMFGAAMRKIEDLDLTEKQKSALRFKMTVDILADQPAFSGLIRVSQALEGEKGAEKFAGQVSSTLVPFSGFLGEWARQQDSYKTKQEYQKERRVKSDSFTDEFKKKIPWLRETLPDAKFTKVGKSGKSPSQSASPSTTDFSNMTNEELMRMSGGTN